MCEFVLSFLHGRVEQGFAVKVFNMKASKGVKWIKDQLQKHRKDIR